MVRSETGSNLQKYTQWEGIGRMTQVDTDASPTNPLRNPIKWFNSTRLVKGNKNVLTIESDVDKKNRSTKQILSKSLGVIILEYRWLSVYSLFRFNPTSIVKLQLNGHGS